MPAAKFSPISVTLVLWGLSVVNVILGMSYSESTRMKIFRVEGCQELDRARLETGVKYALKSATRSQASDRVKSAVLVNSAIEDVRLNANPFGRVHLTIRYRTPVAQIADRKGVYLDADGVLFSHSKAVEGLPTVQPPDLSSNPKVTLLGDWLGQVAAEIARAVTEYPWKSESRIDIGADGEVSLIIRGETTVRLGSPYDIDSKMTALKTILSERPDLLEKVSVLNLVVPTRPTVVPKVTQQ